MIDPARYSRDRSRDGSPEASFSNLAVVQPSDDASRTTQLLAERWATLFCTVQRRRARGEALKFTGAFIAAGAWITFIVLAKGSTDFQASDLLIPAILTAIAVAVGVFGFVREKRANEALREATARLARELDAKPTSSRFEAQEPSMDPRSF